METLLLLAPLTAALISGLTWRWISELAATLIATALTGLGTLIAWALLLGFDGDPYVVTLGTGLRSGVIEAPWALRIDALALYGACLAMGVSFLAQLFCLGFTAPARHFTDHETYRPRLIATIALSAFGVLVVLFAESWLQLIAGWEAVVVASYLLIGFYFRKPAATAGAPRAVISARLASLALVVAAGLAFAASESLLVVDTLALSQAGEDQPVAESPALAWIGALICVAILVMMAQVFAQVWSLDAVEAPAPGAWVMLVGGWGLAALIVALKLDPALDAAAFARQAMVLGGVITALYAASSAIAQVDLRRIIGYLAAAQFGLIVAALGLGAPHLALSLMTGLAAALGALVLGLAALMQKTGAMVNLRQLGGMKARAPTAFWTMLIGALALSGLGLPLGEALFLGLAQAPAQAALFQLAQTAGPAVLIGLGLAMGLSAFAAWRMVFSAFLGRARGDKQGSAEPADLTWTMRGVIYTVLAASLGLGLLGPAILAYLATITAQGRELEPVALAPAFSLLSAAPALLGLAGLALAWYFYLHNPSLSRRLRDNQEGLARFFLNGWYLEQGLEIALAAPIRGLAGLLRGTGERQVLDGGTHWLAQSLVPRLGRGLMRGQASALYSYAFPAVLGVVLVIALISFRALN